MTAAHRIEVTLADQRLRLFEGDRNTMDVSVSTAARGAGEIMDSQCTPRGRHVIRAKIGSGAPLNAVFEGRRPTGELYTPELAEHDPGRDWILTRILWLSGTERGRNRLGEVDSMRRFIYIHGCPDEAPLGVARSHGCVRMRNTDIVELFDRVRAGAQVNILE